MSDRGGASMVSSSCALLAGALTLVSLLLNDDRTWVWWVLIAAAVTLIGVGGFQLAQISRRRRSGSKA